jgi:nitrogen fixation NifU-like protein
VYSPELLDHFQNPRNAGEVEGADAVIEVQNPVCGDVLRLTARVHGGRLAEVRFKAKGCVPAMACGSRLTEMLQGQTPQEARAVTPQQLTESLGGLPATSAHAAALAIDAARALLNKLP